EECLAAYFERQLDEGASNYTCPLCSVRLPVHDPLRMSSVADRSLQRLVDAFFPEFVRREAQAVADWRARHPQPAPRRHPPPAAAAAASAAPSRRSKQQAKDQRRLQKETRQLARRERRR